MLGPGSTGRPAAEVQLLVLATRGQEVTASGLEDGLVWGLAVGTTRMRGECRASGDALVTDPTLE